MGADRKTVVYSGVDRTTGSFITDRPGIELLRSRIVDDTRTTVADAGAEGAIVAMSGGIDSTVMAALAVEALGSDRVVGLGLPCHKTEQAGVSDARTIAEGLGIEFEEIQLRPLLQVFEETVTDDLEPQYVVFTFGSVVCYRPVQSSVPDRFNRGRAPYCATRTAPTTA